MRDQVFSFIKNLFFLYIVDAHPVDNGGDVDVDEVDNLVEEEADDDEEETGRVNRYQRKILTWKRKVNSIDAALDPSNYNSFNIPEPKTISGTYNSGDKNIPNTVYNFTNQPKQTNGR